MLFFRNYVTSILEQINQVTATISIRSSLTNWLTKIAIYALTVVSNFVVPLLYQNMIESSGHWKHEMKVNNIPINALLRILYSCSGRTANHVEILTR